MEPGRGGGGRCADRVQDTGCRGVAREPPGALRALGAPGLNTETPAPLSSCPLPLRSRLLPRPSVQVAPQTHTAFLGQKKTRGRRRERRARQAGSDTSCIACRGLQEKPGERGCQGRAGGGSGASAAPRARAANKRAGLFASGLSGDGSLSPRLSRPTRSQSHGQAGAETRRAGRGAE